MFLEGGSSIQFDQKNPDNDHMTTAAHGEARRGEEVKDAGRGVGKYNADRYQVEHIKMIQCKYIYIYIYIYIFRVYIYIYIFFLRINI